MPSETSTFTITSDDLKTLVKNGRCRAYFLSFPRLRFVTFRFDRVIYPFFTTLLIRSFSRGSCVIEEENGGQIAVNLSLLFRLAKQWVRDFFGIKKVIQQARRSIREEKTGALKSRAPIQENSHAVYLRTDLHFGLKSGGSIGHIAGVLNNLDRLKLKPLFLSSDKIPTVNSSIETHIIAPEGRFWDFREILPLSFSGEFVRKAKAVIDGCPISFIYQRYSYNNFSGVTLAREFQIPFVLEYNGSEVWVRKNWSWGSFRYAELTGEIERLNLERADLIVVVSKVLEEELINRRINPSKILFNPNGVDVNRYRPDIDGNSVRQKYGLADKKIIGFMGTFGPWHGAEMLAKAAGLLLSGSPELREKIHLLFIGDGTKRPLAESLVRDYGIGASCTFTGQIDQAIGPSYLAACDLFVCPHVPNPDGSPFFGSPTKLFEYMAMGRPILASNLGQIGEVLTHGETGWLVCPGSEAELAQGLRHLLSDAELCKRMGRRARLLVEEKYSWETHTRRIVEKLANLYSCSL